ncbi:cupredoxin domain-containing protein [Veronia pacifica]|uniref:Copper-binding protein n=1 Tax=Veronia pacifica TaxID=1080227 RepID=A0A1C3EAL7_9GAMM|nr:hypothetical protein [Veronia pacifica]ODA30273.1 hypothetical protein A8L45_20595 [Veronia pacifica]
MINYVPFRFLASAVLLMLSTASMARGSVGVPVGESVPARDVNVSLSDTLEMKFSEKLSVKSGEAINFIVTNKGRIRHEFFIGDKAEQIKHRKKIRSLRGEENASAIKFENAIFIEPGETKTLKWRFLGAGKVVIFACNIPGHFEAGARFITVIDN